MDGISLTQLAEEQLQAARSGRAGRSAHTVHGGHDHMLRQTLIALVGGAELAEHISPGQATLQVLQGQVRITAGTDTWAGGPGDMLLPRSGGDLYGTNVAPPKLSATGADTNIDLLLESRGSGVVKVNGAAALFSGGALGTPSSGNLTNCT